MSYQSEFWLDFSKLCLDISEISLNMIIFQKTMNRKSKWLQGANVTDGVIQKFQTHLN